MYVVINVLFKIYGSILGIENGRWNQERLFPNSITVIFICMCMCLFIFEIDLSGTIYLILKYLKPF